MPLYRITGTRTFLTSAPHGTPKEFRVQFSADDDEAARKRWPTLKGQGEVWDRMKLVKIVVPEEVEEVALYFAAT